MSMKKKSILALMAMLPILFALAAPALAESITRIVPSGVFSGTNITIGLNVTLENSTFYAVDEIVPSGWSVTDAIGPGVNWTTNPPHIYWVCIGNCVNTTLTYDLSVPPGANGTYSFSGTYAMTYVDDTLIGGPNSINVTPSPTTNFAMSTTSMCNGSLMSGKACTDKGANVTVKVLVESVADYNKTVNLTVSNLPPGITVNFSPTSGTPPFQSTMLVKVASTAEYGSYSISIRGRSVDRNNSVMLNLYIQSLAPPVSVCGNGIIESGESCDNGRTNGPCSASCSASCTVNSCPGPGPSPGPSATVSIAQDAVNLTYPGGTLSANTPLRWSMNQPSKFPWTYVNITAKAAQSNILIQMLAYSSKPVGISNISDAATYRWVGVTSSITDANLSSVRIGFAVSKTWLASSGIDRSAVALFRFSGSTPAKLNTTLLSNDTNWTYYEATSPGLSVFAIAGQMPACPSTCAEATAWSVCTSSDPKTVAGSQSRTEYYCDATTGYACRSKTAIQNCCPIDLCPTSTDWSICIGQRQNKTDWSCSPDYKCVSVNTTQACVDAETAQVAVLSAQNTVDAAKAAGKNVTAAEQLLGQSRTAFANKNYELSQDLAIRAETAAQQAQPLPVPFIPILAAIGAMAGAGAGALALVKRRKPRATTAICIVCGEPTALNIRCASCGQFACVRHIQTIAGRQYCTNCVKRMYMR